ncbi:MAG TPA: gamma-glutamyltransferase [Balneolaceae bacterium]|nr:gamma-glutamyltransferase [Balneolaceae bacterium]
MIRLVMRLFSGIAIICILFTGFISTPQKVFAQVGWTKTYDHAVVVTGNKIASRVGKKILKNGGNAVDAAVAVQFAMAVTQPRAGNIGGGGFMVLHIKDGSNRALDFREKAPHKASRNMYIRHGKYIPSLSRDSAIASGVPGVVAGMAKAEKNYGDLTLKKVIAPAIKLAKNGFRLTWFQAQMLNRNAASFKNYKASTKYFTKANGQPYHEGDLFVQKDLAKTLKRIARHGRAGFYSGKTANLIVKEEKKQGGIIDHQDLKNYKSIWRNPVQATYHGFHLHIMPAPSSGGVAIAQMLEMLKPYDLKKLGFNSAKYVHLLTEVMRRAFADRAYFMGDPNFVNIPRDTLLSKSYNRNRMKSFSWNHATRSRSLSHGNIPSFHVSRQTTHFSIVDSAGDAVAVTTTLNGFYGNHISIGGAGFLMNNEMDDFASKPGKPNMYGLIQGEANAIRPGKRMLSSMSPTVVTKNNKVRMVLGAAGGPMIINTVLETFLDLSVFGMNAQQAISAPRFHNQWMPDTLYYEKYGLNKDTRRRLKALGHHLKISRYNIGVGHIIYINKNGKREGGVDPRGNGSAEGF